MIDNFRYRPEIDGLRAIAVLAVVLFHGGFSCPVGYVGVDVFFVISGVFSILSVGFVLSFALSIYGVARHSTAVFYLVPTRAWELLLGSIVAFLPPEPSLLGRPNLRGLFALAGFALILIPVFIYTSKTP